MAETQILDDDLVGALQVPEGKKERIVWDEQLSGFGARALPSGKRTWIVGFRAMGPGGKAGSRRRVIGIPGEMTIGEARLKAEEVLAEMSPGNEPDGRQEDQPAGAAAAPEPAADPSRDDAAAEEEPGAVEEAEAASAATTSAGVEDNPETGETLPAGAEEYEHPDEDLGGLEDVGQGPDAGRDPEAVAAEDAGRQAVEDILAGTMDGTAGAGAADPYEEVAETAGRAERSRMPRVEAEGGTGAEARGEAGAAGGDPDGDVDAGESEARDRGRGENGAGETEAAARQRPGRTRKAFGIATGMAGKVVEGGRALMSKKAEGSPAQEEPAKAVRDEPEAGPAADGKVEAGETDGSEGSDEPVLAAREQTTAGVEEESRDGKALSDETVAGLTESVASLARNLDGMRVVTDRIEAWHVKMGPQMEQLTGSTAVIAGDRRQGRRRRARAVLAMVAVLAVGIGGGIAIQSRVEVAPQADPTLGWKDHFWNYYGETFMGCFQRAKKAESGYADCAVKVRGR